MMGKTGLLMRSMSSARSAFGRTTPTMPAFAHRATSSRNHSVFAPLIRMRTGRSGDTHAAALARDASLLSGGTASSRSMMTASAPLASAFAKRSGRLPGTNRYDRAVTTTPQFLCSPRRIGSAGDLVAGDLAAALLFGGAGWHPARRLVIGAGLGTTKLSVARDVPPVTVP